MSEALDQPFLGAPPGAAFAITDPSWRACIQHALPVTFQPDTQHSKQAVRLDAHTLPPVAVLWLVCPRTKQPSCFVILPSGAIYLVPFATKRFRHSRQPRLAGVPCEQDLFRGTRIHGTFVWKKAHWALVALDLPHVCGTSLHNKRWSDRRILIERLVEEDCWVHPSEGSSAFAVDAPAQLPVGMAQVGCAIASDLCSFTFSFALRLAYLQITFNRATASADLYAAGHTENMEHAHPHHPNLVRVATVHPPLHNDWPHAVWTCPPDHLARLCQDACSQLSGTIVACRLDARAWSPCFAAPLQSCSSLEEVRSILSSAWES